MQTLESDVVEVVKDLYPTLIFSIMKSKSAQFPNKKYEKYSAPFFKYQIFDEWFWIWTYETEVIYRKFLCRGMGHSEVFSIPQI